MVQNISSLFENKISNNSNAKIITQKLKYGCHKEYEGDIRVNLINLINNIIINNLQEKKYEINLESAILENSKS